MKKKLMGFLLSAAMVLGLMTGCGGTSTSGDGGSGSSDTQGGAAKVEESGGDVQVGIVLPTKDGCRIRSSSSRSSEMQDLPIRYYSARDLPQQRRQTLRH